MSMAPGIAWLWARRSLGNQACLGPCRPSALDRLRIPHPSRGLWTKASDLPAIPARPGIKHAHGHTWEDSYR